MSEQHTPERLAAVLATIGRPLTYTAEFVPQSKSRHAGDKFQRLNWRVSLTAGGHALDCDYSQGIGLLPERAQSLLRRAGENTICGRDLLNHYAEHGRHAHISAGGHILGTREAFRAPSLLDVLSSLLTDASAIDSATFPDWCAEFGLDVDSRSAEKTYRACIETGLKLRAMFGDVGLAALREFFTDY